jgi:hypothetical protein
MKTLIKLATRYLQPALANYKTTLAGIAMILHASLVIIDQTVGIANGTAELSPEQLMLAKAEILGGIGFIFSRDADKSSQQSGIRK